jgi:light-regulated signal transduction histidine kinase (bacteriophytochrome)
VLKPQVFSVDAVIESMAKLLPRLLGEDVELITRLGGRLAIATADFIAAANGTKKAGALLPGRYVVITVHDSGCGMDAATRGRIFKPFFTTKGAGNGTGLRLATVYGIIRQTGGEIACVSTPGAGSTFSIYLPVVARAPHPQVGDLPPRPTGSKTVLLVEDQAAVRRLTRRLLERIGYRVSIPTIRRWPCAWRPNRRST